MPNMAYVTSKAKACGSTGGGLEKFSWRQLNFVPQKKTAVGHNIRKGMKMDTERAYSLGYGGRRQGKRERNLSVSW